MHVALTVLLLPLVALCLQPSRAATTKPTSPSTATSPFYFSAWAPNKYHKGDKIPLWFNKLSSEQTQLSFSYIDVGFTCKSGSATTTTTTTSSPRQYQHLNIGELFRGDRTVNSGVTFPAAEDVPCAPLCSVQLTQDLKREVATLIKQQYLVEWELDDLPAGQPINASTTAQLRPGFDLGKLVESTNEKQLLFYNHLDITITYEQRQQERRGDVFLVTGFVVEPKSIDWLDAASACQGRESRRPLTLDTASPTTALATMTYSVKWRQSEMRWTNRWSVYIDASNRTAHMYAMVNSLLVLVVLTAVVAYVILTTLRRDIAMYNSHSSGAGGGDAEALSVAHDDVAGWKLIHGDVFRQPRSLSWLAPLLGAGAQLLTATSSTIAFGMVGVLNPSYRGGFLQYALFTWAFAGAGGGYWASRVLKSFSLPQKSGGSLPGWFANAVYTATAFPLFLFTILCVYNTFHWARHSSVALPAGTFVALLAVWLLISLPLVVIGAWFGQRQLAISHPVRTHQIPRQVPTQPWYLSTAPAILLAGVVPFTVIFMELFFILKSIWSNQYYYLWGFLGLTCFMVAITLLEVTLVMVYFQLCAEDYRWMWRSFLLASSSGVYILVFGAAQYLLRPHSQIASISYFAYLFTGSAVYVVCTGTIGFFAAYAFVRRIYGAIKID